MNTRLLQFSIGFACAVFFLALAFYRTPLAAVGATLARTDPCWLGAALFAYALNLALRARRWQIILRGVAFVPYATVARVLLVGYGLNTIMPARLGELLRAEYCKKTCGLRRAPVLTSIVVERLFDGLTVVGCLAIGLHFAAGSGRPAATLVDVVIAGGALFVAALAAALVFGRLQPSRLCRRFPRVADQLSAVERGLTILRNRLGVAVAILTLIIYVPEALTAWLVVKAAGMGLGVPDTLVLVGAASLGTLLPSGPAFLGTLQFAYVLAIEFAGGPAAIGVAAATLAQLCILLPVAVVATLILAHGSGGLFYPLIARSSASAASPTARSVLK